MKITVLIIILCVACGNFGSPLNATTSLDRHARELDLIANTRNLINELITNLGNAAQQARVSVETFRIGVAEEATRFKERINNEIRKLRESITDVVANLTDMYSEAAVGVQCCVETAIQSAEETFTQSLEEVMDCGEVIINDLVNMIESKMQLSMGASEFTEKTADELKECYNSTSSKDIIALGRCVGSLAVQAEIKSTSYFAQSALLVGRINFSLIALPARLEMCAGSGLLRAGMDTANTMKDIFVCSVSSMADALTESETKSNSTLIKVHKS